MSRPLLFYGSTGQAVVLLQKALNLADPLSPKIDADGVFGSQTRGRVRDFQQENNLTPDGVVGPQTHGVLEDFYGLVQQAMQLMPGPDFWNLSPRRRQVLGSILPGVVPSFWPDARFNTLTRGQLDWSQLPDNYTTCGCLPAYVAQQLGGRGKIIAGGTNGLRDAAAEQGAWITADMIQRPLPGDFYGLTDQSDPNGNIVHVGVVVYLGMVLDETATDLWKTADSGQGIKPNQYAGYINRAYNPSTGQLNGEVNRAGVRPFRTVAGWVNIDAYPFPG
jgi:peptidoglycan hydrolase-like protein with peptidoglycan-binding domain